MNLQIVCRNVNPPALQKILQERFGQHKLVVQSRKDHAILNLTGDCPSPEILTECRLHAFAYFRVTEWESGGGTERAGRAICVAGLNGEPLKPIALRQFGNRANTDHALFGSRSGLLVVKVSRLGSTYLVEVTKHQIQKFQIQEPQSVVSSEFTTSPKKFLEDVPLENDFCVPCLRAALLKVDCPYCTHVHYCAAGKEGGDDER